jgi:hypothetical protein
MFQMFLMGLNVIKGMAENLSLMEKLIAKALNQENKINLGK